ncbi:hypothetical protein MKI84_04425 [Ancylobacter sp. A5.8]|uniref:hypothetical protein n=1 Tax=Ancylobacter gelatini TaxID=2919920 RepID=UPI001F4F1011|nr:hypothetical protein [Ancylobacter gelatini]MCJ8142154.1 hypothetical protein [Ancylobacter gelatini]
MRTALLVLPLALMAAPAMAQSMPNSLNMTCASARELVRREGAVVIGTGPVIYERYVANRGYCTVGQQTEPAWVQTADQEQCYIGSRCREHTIKKKR